MRLCLSLLSLAAFSCSMLVLTPNPAFATESEPHTIKTIRPYASGGVFLHLNGNVTGCDNNVFEIPPGDTYKPMVSAAIAALLAGKPIKVEWITAGCSWGTLIQSLYLCTDASCSL
jgi:hypothetical protein